MNAFVLCCAVLGGCAGAVTPRPAARLAVPTGSPPAARCRHCGRPFGNGAAGWFRVGAACPRCPGTDLCRVAGRGGWLPAVLGAGAAAGVGWRIGPRPELPAFLAVVVSGVLLALVDSACRRLPDPIVGLLALATVPPIGASALLAGDPGRLGRALLAGGCAAAVHLLGGRHVGLGDVKLAAVLGVLLGWLGWSAAALGVVLAVVVNGCAVLALLAARRIDRTGTVPYGPALLAGWFAAVLVG